MFECNVQSRDRKRAECLSSSARPFAARSLPLISCIGAALNGFIALLALALAGLSTSLWAWAGTAGDADGAWPESGESGAQEVGKESPQQAVAVGKPFGGSRFRFLNRLLSYHLQGLHQTPRDEIDPRVEMTSKTMAGPIAVVDELLRRGMPVVRILDLGAGPGRFPLALFQHVAASDGLGEEAAKRIDYTGTDILYDPQAEAALRERIRSEMGIDAQLTMVEDDISSPGRRGSGRYDVVVAALLLHELPAEKIPLVLANMLSELAPGGRLVIVDPSSPPELERGSVTWHQDEIARILRFIAADGSQPNVEATVVPSTYYPKDLSFYTLVVKRFETDPAKVMELSEHPETFLVLKLAAIGRERAEMGQTVLDEVKRRLGGNDPASLVLGPREISTLEMGKWERAWVLRKLMHRECETVTIAAKIAGTGASESEAVGRADEIQSLPILGEAGIRGLPFNLNEAVVELIQDERVRRSGLGGLEESDPEMLLMSLSLAAELALGIEERERRLLNNLALAVSNTGSGIAAALEKAEEKARDIWLDRKFVSVVAGIFAKSLEHSPGQRDQVEQRLKVSECRCDPERGSSAGIIDRLAEVQRKSAAGKRVLPKK